MSMWSDITIKKQLSNTRTSEAQMDPYDPSLVNPASIDVRLHGELRFHDGRLAHDLRHDGCLALQRGYFLLGTTCERVTLSRSVQAQVSGKSSLGRLGLQVHQTAGFIDPGFTGQITLELYNVGDVPVVLKEGMRIAQIAFVWLDRSCERPYGHPDLGSHYQGQRGATPSWMRQKI